MSQHPTETQFSRAFCPASSLYGSDPTTDAHSISVEVLYCALRLGTNSSWGEASAILEASLEPQEALMLAWAALSATKPELARQAVSVALGGAGAPLPTIFDVMADASWWADVANAEERAAYAVACFNRFSKRERDEFRAFVGGR